MTTDLELARRRRARAERRAAREVWLNQVFIEVRAEFPRGVLGALIGAMFLLTPPLFIWLGLRLGQWTGSRRGGSGPGSAA